ncbi:phosphoethanolamine transferase [Stenotrophomonas maltophilia]|uniref:phosphoethanolamine transferase n=1 Tax=Stenotrophomonas maltophilia TaxID=40324 RepID=UPI0007EF469B|nr:phosphoethanolamine--lipid A transferase [Stenotrophomonas maltophilia]OBU52513.1 phosphoethanolamine transferase [Stenotrophomonas maltophilia]
MRQCLRFPRPHPIILVWAAAFFFTTIGNIALWKSLWELTDLNGVRSILFLASLPLVLFCLFNLLLTPLLALPFVRKPLLAILIVTSAACSYFMLHYNVLIDRSMVQNVFETNQAELNAYLSLPLLLTLLALGAMPAAALALVRTASGAGSIRSLLVWPANVLASLVMLLVIGFAFYKDYSSLLRNNRYIRDQVLPLNVMRHTHGYLKSLHSTRQQPLRPIGMDARRIPGPRPKLVVMVVGETARSQNFQLNGYPRATNPRLSRTEGVISFSDVSSCGTATAISVPCMFSQMTRQQYDNVRAATEENVLDILQRTGVSVLWRNNNNGGCKGVCERVPTEDMPALKVAGQCVNTDGTCYDDVLLHQLGTRIDAINGDGLVVLHQLGSHGPTYFERYPAASRAFSPTCDSNQIQHCSNEALVNTYDNTLVHTDRVLAETIDLLQGYSDRRDVALIYVSDHGESLGERGMYLHGTPYFIAPREQTQVPMVMWFSSDFGRNAGLDMACLRGNALQRAHSHDNIFHSLLGLFGVSSTVYQRNLDVFAGCRPSGSPAVAAAPAKKRHRLMPVTARNVARYCAARAKSRPAHTAATWTSLHSCGLVRGLSG